MAKKKRKLPIFLLCILLSIPAFTQSKRKCSSLSDLRRKSVLQHGVFKFCDNPDSCECKDSNWPRYCHFADDCVGCLHNGHTKLCSQYDGQSSPPVKETCADDKFMCKGECMYKIWKKECNGECIERVTPCKAEGGEWHCNVNHTPDAPDFKCGSRCDDGIKPTKEDSNYFDCGGMCKEKRTHKECGNKCMMRDKLCYSGGDPCKVNHQNPSTDWKCGDKCYKALYKKDYKDCNGFCLPYYQECKAEETKSTESSSTEETSNTEEVTDLSRKIDPNEDDEEKKDGDDDDNLKKKKKDDDDGSELKVIAIIISIIFAFILIGVIICFVQKKKEKRKKSLTIKYLPGDIPEHRILEKNDDLLDTISQAAKEKNPNKEEFKAIQEYVRVNINEAKTIGMQEENKNRNRYHDILPYNSNIVNLKKPTGDPPLTYMSASMITFPDFGQNFIAIQAPKENMFSSFWQMIHEQEISTIVMITGLVEGRKTKAHKYWPDMEDQDFELDNGFKLKYISHSFHGTYYQRQITLTDANGKERNIEQLQTTAWLDMTAPKDTKVLLDLIYKARELAGDPNMKNTAKRKSISPKTKRSKKCPILVHCSAGVGRTGTFIALYKLVADYDNERVKTLDLFSTVVKMREQRMNMVQKYEQYHYIIKCLHHYIIAQTDIYQA